MSNLGKKIASQLNLNETNTLQAIKLLFEEECTIPFITRYRKERTGGMDEVQIRDIRDNYKYLLELEGLKTRYLKVVEDLAKTQESVRAQYPAIEKKFLACTTKQELEDLYLPYKPKRRTRAQIAKEKGLEPILEKLLAERASVHDLDAWVQAFVTEALPKEEILQGIQDILAERISENAEYRLAARTVSFDTAVLQAEAAPTTLALLEQGNAVPEDTRQTIAKYANYFEYAESIQQTQAHRVMAVRRGEAEKILRTSIECDRDQVLHKLQQKVRQEWPGASDTIAAWLQDTLLESYKRLISPSIETEIRVFLKNRSEEEAIAVFAKNLEKLLLLPPLPGTVVMGVDPGLRTGSKLAVVSETGQLLGYTTIHPNYGNLESNETLQAVQKVLTLIRKFKVQYLAVGNGTGGREVDQLLSHILKANQLKNIQRVIVNESGASVYSTEQIARDEFPDLDPTIRSAVSIARRLQDPLAELVKIEPRSIGVGQYQHDCNVTKLSNNLKETVESCVNRVGVDINTASDKLLTYVSGIGPALAKNIVTYRNEHGLIRTRKELTEVPSFGPKAFQQAAGFLRVLNAENPLDRSAVHPESYAIVEKIAADLSLSLEDLVGKEDVVKGIALEKYVSEAVGMPTLLDISHELVKPGRDPRGTSRFTYSNDTEKLEDLKAGMKMKGRVTNVTNFGAFVDIGVHQDGLVHISELSDQFVKDPTTVVAVGDVLDVQVLQVDMLRRRISLTCRTQRPPEAAAPAAQTNAAAPRGPARPASRPGQSGPRRPHSSGPQTGRPAPTTGSRPQPTHTRPPKRDEPHFSLGDLLSKFNS